MQLRRSVILIALTTALATGQEKAPLQSPTLSQGQIQELIRRSADKDLENDKKLRDYTYVEREEDRRIDGKGQLKSKESKTYDVLEIYGEQVQKLIAKNDQPLSAGDTQKEDEKIQKLIDKRRKESEAERNKRLAKQQKEREDDRQFVREVADAYNFKFVGIEKLGDRDNYVIDADPKPGYKPVRKEAKILSKLRGRMWIDTSDSQVAKLDVQAIDTVSFGLFVARLHYCPRLILENTRVNDEVWLQQHVRVTADVRLALVKELNFDVDVTDRDYKKFGTDTKIMPITSQQASP